MIPELDLYWDFNKISFTINVLTNLIFVCVDHEYFSLTGGRKSFLILNIITCIKPFCIIVFVLQFAFNFIEKESLLYI